jgi:hypothetical protein
MTNARDEFVNHVAGKAIVCATVEYGSYLASRQLTLPCEWTASQYSSFLDSLDFDYDDGYGAQYLTGTIWYADGTWSTRHEYDGSEWWEYLQCPAIPEQLLSA